MKKILYLVLVAVLAAAVPAWGQNNQTYTLGKIPAGWTVKANGNTVTVTDSTAIIPAGATVVLTPTNTAKVKKVTLVDATPTTSCRLIDLSQITADSVIQDCDTLTGTLAANVKISIADGATVTLDGVSINGTNNQNYTWAGITCEGDATLILKDDTTNTVKGFYDEYPGIYVPVGSTLTIQGETSGTGKLIASSNGYGAGIGGGYHIPCGNIRIEDGIIEATGGSDAAGIGSGNGYSCDTITISGGNVTATGGSNAAGIGSGYLASCRAITISGGTIEATGGEYAAGIGSGIGSSCDTITITGGNITATGGSGAAGIGSAWTSTVDESSCGNITISGGTVNATGGTRASGIGSGKGSSCGAITITSDVTRVTATSDAAVSIGYGENSSCGTITFGTQQMYDGSDWTTNPESGQTYGGLKLTISTDPNIVIIDTWELTPAPAAPSGAIDGLFSVSSTKQVYFSQGNLRAYNATANSTSGWVWSFAENQWDYIGSSGSNQYINGSMTISKAGYVDLFCWVGTSASYDNYGIMYDNDTQGWAHEGTNFGNSTNDTLKHDWGHNPITNGGNEADIWRTPTNDEWVYLINSRTTAAGTAPTINGTADARYAKAKLFGTNRGLIIFPDTYVHPDGVAYPTGINAAGNTSWNGNQYSAADWAKMEAAGCVFLPCAGIRVYYTQINDKETRGFYASSTPRPETWNQAKVMQFLDTSCTPNANRYRRDAGPVRLVQDAN